MNNTFRRIDDLDDLDAFDRDDIDAARHIASVRRLLDSGTGWTDDLDDTDWRRAA
ncbi:hypothetical protein ACIA8C_17185 [Nocardia sp. NPDC051321]|uniref:hypothetical protein n=1 Tax=Nocardia sp. NPDC051321 TaxID=3364323 RepID=UPI0037ACD4B3